MVNSIATPFGWRIDVATNSAGLCESDLTFTIVGDDGELVLDANSPPRDLEARLIYDFALEIAGRENNDWLRQLGCSPLVEEEHPIDIGARFLRQLREALTSATPAANSLPRLKLRISALEGRLASTEQRIWDALQRVIESESVGGDTSLAHEEMVLRIATEANGRLKGASSGRVTGRMVQWLETRGAVEQIRSLFKPLPWVLRADVTRVSLTVALLLFAWVQAGTEETVRLEPPAAWASLAAISLLVSWIGLPPLLSKVGSRARHAVRPGFLLRWVGTAQGGIAILLAIFVGGSVAANAVSPAVILLLLCIALGAAGVWWWQSCRRVLAGSGRRHREGRIARRRARALLALNAEEALASALLIGLLWGLIPPAIPGSVPSDAPRYSLVVVPEVIALDTGLFELWLRPALVLLVTALTLLYGVINVRGRGLG